MSENWKFSELVYERPDKDQAVKDMRETTQKIQDAKSGEEVLALMLAQEERDAVMMDMIMLARIRHTLDTSDAFYEKEYEWIAETVPTIMPDQLALSDAIAQSPYRDYVEEKLGKQYFVALDLQKKSFCPENIPLMQQEAKLTDEYQKIMAACQVEFQGEKRNLYGLQKFFEDEDREVRKAAFSAYSDFYHGHEERLEEIWDELIRVRNEMGRNLGFENFIPVGYMQQGRTDYGQEDVASFRKQVEEELVPFCQKLYEAQAKRLGIEKVYAFDEEMIFPDGNAHPAGDDDFMIQTAREMYHEMSPETAEFIDFMIGHEMLDLKNKPNKASTGYCTILPARKAPFVFSCFNQTIFDMQVLTHELGHAFAAYRASRIQPVEEYFFSSTDIAEIHSMSMEQFAYPYAERFFGEDADKFRFAHLQQSLTFVPFGVAVDEFQHICYANPGSDAEGADV